jgi:single-stranded-DNA-specific exonuclease
VSEAFEVNSKRVQSLEEGLNEALEYFKDHPPEGLSFYISDEIHPGVMGLIATRLVDEYGLPAFIGSKLENDQVVGSARLPQKSGLSLKEMMSFCPSLIQFGGHAEAAGFELQFEKSAQFKNELSLYLEVNASKMAEAQLGSDYDCEVYLDELDKEFMNWLKHLEPFGVGFEQPIFKVSELEIASVRVLKNKHFKLLVSDKKGNTFDVLWFSPAKDHEVAMVIESQSYVNLKFNFYVNPQVNFFRGRESLQLLLQEVEILGGAGV